MFDGLITTKVGLNSLIIRRAFPSIFNIMMVVEGGENGKSMVKSNERSADSSSASY